MKKQEFNAKVSELCEFVKNHASDDMREELITRNIRNPFIYAAWCEKNMEANLREDYKRRTTFTADFSIAEWCVLLEGMQSVAGTLRNALKNWRDDVEFFAELVIVLNLKSWEHYARGNENYSRMYSELYIGVKELYFDWFDDSHKEHERAMEYYYDYVD